MNIFQAIVFGAVQGLTYLPIGHASLIYDGPTTSFYFRGGTTNPFSDGMLKSLAPLYTLLTKAGVVPTLVTLCSSFDAWKMMPPGPTRRVAPL